ncbi:PREDICTED: reverse mRNAase [Prunus dulcis]|uniref:PREDICTED: reverse mRNAase n=1 Tax=Prunus dulcis TaxID=3755 RepID=A0A5E4FG35_PRUDU|nr:PREDICTED: reverse mRNAase [Prunus dulcis]
MQKLNHTHLVLIPKNASPWNMTQWRPISLCSMAYKITDNILVVHEILHSMKSKKGKDNYEMTLKLDMAKAYDQV